MAMKKKTLNVINNPRLDRIFSEAYRNTMKQVAVTIDSTSGSVTPVQGVAGPQGALVFRQLMTPQLATSQVLALTTCLNFPAG